MQEFIKTIASKRSMSQRKLVRGVGVNDAWYITQRVIDGKPLKCPAYKAWSSMLSRAYNKKLHENRPTYIGVSVCAEWLTFSNFAEWYDSNYIKGYELDKDIKVIGNKEYSPEKCLLIPPCINSMFNIQLSSRGKYPIGVSLNKITRMYRSQIRVSPMSICLGEFDTVSQSHDAYTLAKNAEILRKCNQFPEFRVYLEQHLYTASSIEANDLILVNGE